MNSSLPMHVETFAPHQQARWLLLLAALSALVGVGVFAVGAKLPGLAMIVAAAGLTLIVLPDAAVLLVVFVIYTNAAVIAVRFHGLPHFAGAAAVLLLGIPLYYQLIVRRSVITVLPAVPFIVTFVVVRLIGTLVAHRQDVAIGATTTTLTEGLILYLLVTNVIRDTAMLRRVVWTLAIAGAFLGTLTVIQQVTGNFRNDFGGFAQADFDLLLLEPEQPTNPRSAGPIGEKNYYAQFMLMLLPLTLSRVWGEQGLALRCVAAGAAVLIALGVAFTASRGAAVGFVVMLAAMLALRQIQWRTAMLVAAAAFMLLWAAPTFRERLMESTGLIGVIQGDANVRSIDKSTQGRITEMLAAVLVFWENPVLGVGPANFPAHFLEKADALGFQVHAEERLAHCSYLELAAESGVIGVLAYIGILGVTARELVRARQKAISEESKNLATAFLVTMIVMMITAVFLSFAYERYYWFVLALAAVCAHVAGKAGEEDSTLSERPLATEAAT